MPTIFDDAVDRRPTPRDVLERRMRLEREEFNLRRRVHAALHGLRALGMDEALDPADHRCLIMAWQLSMTMHRRLPDTTLLRSTPT